MLIRIVDAAVVLLLTLGHFGTAELCRPKAKAAKTQNDVNSINFDISSSLTVRHAHQRVYFWPSLTEFEKAVLKDAFFQISRRTCLQFEVLPYKPWYDAERWDEGAPYTIIRKSKNYAAFTDNKIEGIVGRTILYVSANAFEQNSYNQSRGVVMDQVARYMGLRKELERPDASSYIQPIGFALTEYCPARHDADIGAAQRVGLLTKWDTIKLNSMYCPQTVQADPRRGPCVVPRKKDLDEFRRKLKAYKKLLQKN